MRALQKCRLWPKKKNSRNGFTFVCKAKFEFMKHCLKKSCDMNTKLPLRKNIKIWN